MICASFFSAAPSTIAAATPLRVTATAVTTGGSTASPSPAPLASVPAPEAVACPAPAPAPAPSCLTGAATFSCASCTPLRGSQRRSVPSPLPESTPCNASFV